MQTTLAQDEQLRALQRAFVEVCNALAPLAQQSGVWSRVGLHQLGYHRMRERFPELGSQMVCNAIYSVSRACKLVYQHPSSPFAVRRIGHAALPRLHFGPDAPVYFDRHTLSVKDGLASMYTLDGRIRFNLPLDQQDERRFLERRLLEVALARGQDGLALTFLFGDPLEEVAASGRDELFARDGVATPAVQPGDDSLPLPHYLRIIDLPASAGTALRLGGETGAPPGGSASSKSASTPRASARH